VQSTTKCKIVLAKFTNDELVLPMEISGRAFHLVNFKKTKL